MNELRDQIRTADLVTCNPQATPEEKDQASREFNAALNEMVGDEVLNYLHEGMEPNGR